MCTNGHSAGLSSSLAEVPFSLRHACVPLWLESGVAPAEVALGAGHSIAVLSRFYAKAIHGSQITTNAQVERALNASALGQPAAGLPPQVLAAVVVLQSLYGTSDVEARWPLRELPCTCRVH